MNRKIITHLLTITAIMVAVFIAATLTPSGTYTKKDTTVATANLAKADFNNQLISRGGTFIEDNEMPLSETPFTTGFNISLWLIVVSIAAIATGIVICSELHDDEKKRIC